ncbi:phosphotransferase family protein [Aspergillus vadensis CBS 113365]|uniref:Phosphotransferase enzyme family protein n=1 Tax=Aspergillus vadensis (strain CBS 113365 / IMI 142717 / IBT 24658) TaxID=1448311 RepID=A0A319BK31_ASPVC|nr:phosphotransferase enzyme family protein [Aspergillus vadensis CBS 113365]PYH72624.1 phosphotransferase enzyme family protein [Aspergillus vadensis CBS 113365]
MTRENKSVQLTPSMIPDLSNYNVKESSFFTRWEQLPSPEEVRAQAKAQHLAGINPDRRKDYSTDSFHTRPPPVLFEVLNLLVKWGMSLKISEAYCQVPVPEVYGWRTEGEVIYIYMKYIKGKTLEQAWDTGICHELRIICDRLRQLEQDPEDTFVGNIAQNPIYDRTFSINHLHEAGPFPTVRQFHDWFTFLPRRRMSDPYSVPIEPYRYGLPDHCAIKFTHGDLHRSNIIITSSPPHHVLAIIDWEQSGWLPAYWEVRKAQMSAWSGEEWASVYLPMFLDGFDTTVDSWWWYIAALGP